MSCLSRIDTHRMLLRCLLLVGVSGWLGAGEVGGRCVFDTVLECS